MRGAAIVPQQEIAEPPDVLVHELSSLRVIEHRVEQRCALLVRHALDADGHQSIDIDSLAASVLMGAEHGVLAFAESLGAPVVAALDRAVVVMMDGLAAFELVAD